MNSIPDNAVSRDSDFECDSDSDLEDVPLTLPQDDSDSEYSSSPGVNHVSLSLPRSAIEASIQQPTLRLGVPPKVTGEAPSQPVPAQVVNASFPRPSETAGCSSVRASLKPPRLNLPNPASPARTPRVTEELSTLPTCSSGNSGRLHERITVELISHAFVIGSSLIRRGQEAGLALKDIIYKRCSSTLGLDSEDLTLYKLQKVHPDECLPAETAHIGVAVKHSTFTLAALEELLTDNRRFCVLQEKNAQIIDNIHNDFREARQEIIRVQMRAAEHEVECKRLQARCRVLEESNGDAVAWQQRCQALEEKNQAVEHERDSLRQQLERSDHLRVQAFHALNALRREFEAVKASLPVSQDQMQHSGIGSLTASYKSQPPGGNIKSPANSARGSTTPRICYQ